MKNSSLEQKCNTCPVLWLWMMQVCFTRFEEVSLDTFSFFFCTFFYLCEICSCGSPLKPPTVWWRMHTLCVFIISFLHRILAWALSTSKLPFYIQICCLALCSHWTCHLSLKKVTGVLSFSAVVSDELRLKYAIFFFFQLLSLKFWSWNTSVWVT